MVVTGDSGLLLDFGPNFLAVKIQDYLALGQILFAFCLALAAFIIGNSIVMLISY